ncbi:MAG: asparagine synthase-related protein, partial [Candidatus Nanoarchaeia archaeon]|nr:asparagine synthase-related protein [Candidatus Nanoarchaeia archaeon]
LKINNEMNKIVLREAAVKLGLPKEFAYRPKKAAQYGSKFDKTIQKLALKKGFEHKQDYLESL